MPDSPLETPNLPLHITEELESYCIRDADGAPLLYAYFEENDWTRSVSGRMRKCEALTYVQRIVEGHKAQEIPF